MGEVFSERAWCGNIFEYWEEEEGVGSGECRIEKEGVEEEVRNKW